MPEHPGRPIWVHIGLLIALALMAVPTVSRGQEKPTQAGTGQPTVGSIGTVGAAGGNGSVHAVDAGEPGPADAATISPSEGPRVFLMTFSPGALPWERFGHNALCIRDARRGTDIAYNWGLFDFDSESFILRFLHGRLRYWMEGYDTEATAQAYAADGRTIWMQELNLTPDQARTLQATLADNEKPENRYYRYDYFRDNCSTRVRDAIDRAVGGGVSDVLKSQASGRTFRWHTRRLMSPDTLLRFALDAVLGQPADEPISRWEEAFIPEVLQSSLQDVTVPGADGSPRPLIKSSQVIFEGSKPLAATAPRNDIPGALMIGTAIGAVLVGLATLRGRWLKWVWPAVAGTWAMVAGAGGWLALYGWTLTDHIVSRYNENLLQFSPLLVVLAVLVWPMTTGRRTAARIATVLAVVLAATAVLGFMLKAVPAMKQANGPVMAMGIPMAIGLAASVWIRSRQAHQRTETA